MGIKVSKPLKSIRPVIGKIEYVKKKSSLEGGAGLNECEVWRRV
jgi:hypothetical protein